MNDLTCQSNIVTDWNEVALTAIRTTSSKPTVVARALQSTHNAIFDAWAAYDQQAIGVHSQIDRPVVENTEANKAEAISFAAFRTLNELFSDALDLQAYFRDVMTDFGYDPDNAGTDLGTPAGVGNAAAGAVLEFRAHDGSNAENDFADTTGYQPVNLPGDSGPGTPGHAAFDPNAWQPLRVPTGTLVDQDGIPYAEDGDPDSYADQAPLTPHWGGVVPFALQSADQFRPPPPPQLNDDSIYIDALGNITTNDQAYRDQFAEVVEISAGLTDVEKATAEFWADGRRSESPPGHWNQLAQGISERDGHGIDEDVVMYFILNNGVYDASISTWDTKYAYDSVRPQSAIRHLYHDQEIEAWGGPDQGTQTIPGEDWQPYQNVTFVTPPFPEYISGHSTFSASSAEILRLFTGTDEFFDGQTVGNLDLDGNGELDLLGQITINDLAFEAYEGPPIVLQWETLSEAAEEAGWSRVLGGIHMQDGNLRGLEAGRDIGALVFEESMNYVNGTVSAMPEAFDAFLAAASAAADHDHSDASDTGFRMDFNQPQLVWQDDLAGQTFDVI